MTEHSTRPSRTEVAAILGLMACGAILRFGSFGQLGLTHFDEGIYAMAGFWPFTSNGLRSIDPTLIPYAPPGFAMLIGLAYLALGISDLAVVAASAICGVLTIPIVGVFARRTFGPASGLIAAALSAFSIPHIAFSRKGLSDAPFLLTWMIAMEAGACFLETQCLGRAILLGTSVGVAQHFKYNGWLAGVVVLVAAALPNLGPLKRGEPRPILRTMGLAIVAAAASLVVYSPWIAFVERHGGYAALLRHHRGYVSGLAAWPGHWSQQLSQNVALSGGTNWSIRSLAFIGLLCILSIGNVRRGVLVVLATQRGRLRFVACLAGSVAVGYLLNAGWWIGLLLAPRWVAGASPRARLVAVWWVIFSVLTPFYHPYARLWLPLHAVGWLLLAGGFVAIGAVVRESGERADAGRKSESKFGGFDASAVVAIGFAGFAQQWASGATPLPLDRYFRDARIFQRVAASLGASSTRGGASSGPLPILARRPLAYYLAMRGVPFRLEEGLGALERSTHPGDRAIVDGAVLEGGGRDRAAWGSLRAWRTVESWAEVPDPVTLLDIRPDAAYLPRGEVKISIRLLRRILTPIDRRNQTR